jgi:hypothetical protein
MRIVLLFLLVFGLLPTTTSIQAAGLPAINPLVTRLNMITVRIKQSGLIAIPSDQLATAGWKLDQIQADKVHVYDQGHEIPIQISGGDGMLTGATIRFIAKANTSRYSAERVYWLTYDQNYGLRAPISLVGEPLLWQPKSEYNAGFAGPSGDRWFGASLQAGQTVPITLTLPTAVPAGTVLEFGVVGMERRDHRLEVRRAGQLLGTLLWSDADRSILQKPQAAVVSLTLPIALAAGTHQLNLRLSSTGLPSDGALVEFVRLPTIRPNYSATPIPFELAAQAALDLRNGPQAGQTGADYLIISHSDFLPALGPLIALKAQQGQQVAVLDVQAAYDAWSNGSPDPEAIRSLIRTAAAQWKPAPKAVLLVGSGSVRSDASFIPPYLVESDPMGEIPCDSCFVRLDGNDVLADRLPDLPIGRLPVRTLEEARVVIAKTVTALQQPPSGAWQQHAILLADNDREADGTPDPAGGFVAAAETVRSLLPAPWQSSRIYYAPDRPASAPAYPDPLQARCALFAAWDGSRSDPRCTAPDKRDNGASLLVYSGHANPWQWATTALDADPPYLYTLYDGDRLSNGSRLPILLNLSCLTGSFANPELFTTDELLLLNEGGGISASLSSAGMVAGSGHEPFAKGVVPVLVAGGTLGEAHLAGLRSVLDDGRGTSLLWSYQLLGDPQMTLPQSRSTTIHLPVVVQP